MSPELFTNRECIPVASPLDARDTHPSKTGLGGAPSGWLLGPPARISRPHRRHFLQQSTYTIRLAHKIDSGWSFAPHEGVFARDNPHQDVLWKFIIPSTERVKVLKMLDAYNLNAFSLFESEESLMETMALRQLDFKR